MWEIYKLAHNCKRWSVVDQVCVCVWGVAAKGARPPPTPLLINDIPVYLFDSALSCKNSCNDEIHSCNYQTKSHRSKCLCELKFV